MAAVTPLVSALDMCQRTQHAHKKCQESLKADLEAGKMDAQAFNAEFVTHLQRVLVITKREPAVERLIDFMCKFAASNESLAIHVLQVRFTRQELAILCAAILAFPVPALC